MLACDSSFKSCSAGTQAQLVIPWTEGAFITMHAMPPFLFCLHFFDTRVIPVTPSGVQKFLKTCDTANHRISNGLHRSALRLLKSRLMSLGICMLGGPHVISSWLQGTANVLKYLEGAGPLQAGHKQKCTRFSALIPCQAPRLYVNPSSARSCGRTCPCSYKLDHVKTEPGRIYPVVTPISLAGLEQLCNVPLYSPSMSLSYNWAMALLTQHCPSRALVGTSGRCSR